MLMGGRGYLSLRYCYAANGGVLDVPDHVKNRSSAD